MSQKSSVIRYIDENGYIDRLKAFLDLGIFELSSIIVTLEKEGYKFHKKPKYMVSRYGQTVRYIEYSFEDENEVLEKTSQYFQNIFDGEQIKLF